MAFFIDGPLGHPDDPIEGIGCVVDLFAFLNDNGADPLAFPGCLDRSLGKYLVAPSDGVTFTGIPFDDVMRVLSVFQGDQGLKSIVARVCANQEWLFGQFLGTGNHPLDEVNKAILAMLASRSEFNLHAPALHAEISGNGRVPIIVFVGAAYPLLLGVGVVLGEDVHIQRDHAVLVTGDWGTEPLEHGS